MRSFVKSFVLVSIIVSFQACNFFKDDKTATTTPIDSASVIQPEVDSVKPQDSTATNTEVIVSPDSGKTEAPAAEPAK